MKIRALCPELAEKALKELGEDPKRVEGDIIHIQDWISKQPHLRASTDDQWILTFLRGCKFSLERTKEKIDMFYTLKTTVPEFWRYKYNEPKFMEILDLGANFLLPKIQNVTAPRIFIMRSGRVDASKYHITELMSVANVIQQIAMYEDDTLMVAGGLALIDFEGMGATHLMQITPTLMKKMAVMLEDSAPVRQKGIHFINTPTGFETVFNFMKGLLNEKNRSRLHVHNKNYDELYKYIPKDVLPSEYGGNGPSITEIIDYWKKKVLQYSSWLEEDLKNGTDESKRPGKPKTAETMFGVEGSFRQLTID